MSPLRTLTILSLVVLGLLSSCGQSVERPEAPNDSSANSTSVKDTGAAIKDTIEAPKAATSEATTSPIQATATGPDCDSAVTQLALNECAYQDYEVADAAQRQQYQQTLLATLPPAAQQALTTANLAWSEFRELDCVFARSQYAGGSIESLIYYDCLSARSRDRTSLLTSKPLPDQPLDERAADTELNQQYQNLLALLTPETTEAMTTVQLSWIEYRDRHCDFETTYRNVELTHCLAQLSQSRAIELARMIEARSL